MAEAKQNTAIIDTITATFAKSLFAEQYYILSEHWRQIKARAEVYSDIDSYKCFSKSWSINRNTRWHYKEIVAGLEALCELENSEIPAKLDIAYEIVHAIDAELSFLELRQYRKLIKDQEIYRPEVLALQNSLQIKVDQSRQRMREKKLSEAFLVCSTTKIKPYLERHQKFYFDFDYAIQISGLVSDIISPTSSSITIGRFIPLEILSYVSPTILFIIPAISGIVAAIPLLFGTLKSYYDNRKTIVKFFNTILALVVFAGIGVAISMPFTVPAISGTFIIGAIIKDYFKPTVDLIISIRKKKQQLLGLQHNAHELLKAKGDEYKLEAHHKTALLKSLEIYTAKYAVESKEIIKARTLITTSDMSLQDIIANPLIQQATNITKPEKLKNYLFEKTEEQCRAIQSDLILLRSQRWRMLALSANGVLTIVGTVLFCVPTPLTMLIGASIVGASYATNAVIKYDLIPKGYKYVKSIFKKTSPCFPQKKVFHLNASMENLHRTLLSKHRESSDTQLNMDIEQTKPIEKVMDIIEPPITPSLTHGYAPM